MNFLNLLANSPVRDSGAENLLSSVTADLVEQKTYKEKIVTVATIINDGFDEIVDIFSDSKNNTENVSSSIQFELTEDGGTLLSYINIMVA